MCYKLQLKSFLHSAQSTNTVQLYSMCLNVLCVTYIPFMCRKCPVWAPSTSNCKPSVSNVMQKHSFALFSQPFSPPQPCEPTIPPNLFPHTSLIPHTVLSHIHSHPSSTLAPPALPYIYLIPPFPTHIPFVSYLTHVQGHHCLKFFTRCLPQTSTVQLLSMCLYVICIMYISHLHYIPLLCSGTWRSLPVAIKSVVFQDATKVRGVQNLARFAGGAKLSSLRPAGKPLVVGLHPEAG